MWSCLCDDWRGPGRSEPIYYVCVSVITYNWPSNVGLPRTEEGRKNPSTLLLRTLVTASMLTDLLSFFYGKTFPRRYIWWDRDQDRQLSGLWAKRISDEFSSYLNLSQVRSNLNPSDLLSQKESSARAVKSKRFNFSSY